MNTNLIFSMAGKKRYRLKARGSYRRELPDFADG
jgi:hypothetical protein